MENVSCGFILDKKSIETLRLSKLLNEIKIHVFNKLRSDYDVTECCDDPSHVYMRVHKTYPKYIFHPRGKRCFVNLISIFVKVPKTNNAKKGSM